MTEYSATPPVLPPRFREVLRLSPIVGGVALVLCVVGWIFSPRSFYPAYLCAWLFWLALSLGSLAFVMLHHMTGGEWGYMVRRFGEAARNVLPLMLVLFIPIIIGTRTLYPWREGNPAHDVAAVVHRAEYFPFWFWIVRYLVYFAVWILLSWVLSRLSFRNDTQPNPRGMNLARKISAPGMVFYIVLMSLASVDWLMSREPEWRSTVFGFIICMGQAVSGGCFLIILLALFSNVTPIRERVTGDHFNDLGNLLLTCVIMWAYVAFSQLLITWLGNSQGEVTWYMPRTNGIWHVFAAILIIFHFCVPFLLLLMRGIKRNPRTMIWLCSGLLVMRALDLFWMATPSGDDPDTHLPVMVVLLTIAAIVGIGGLWIWMFLWLLERHPLMPLGETVPLRPHDSPLHMDPLDVNESHGTRPGTESSAVA